MAFCKEGFSQRLWGLMYGLLGPSIFCPSIEPAAEMLGQALGLVVIRRLSVMQVRAGVLQLLASPAVPQFSKVL